MKKISRLAIVALFILILSGCDTADMAVTNINQSRNSNQATLNQNVNQEAVLGEKIKNTEADVTVVTETVASDTNNATPEPTLAPAPVVVPTTAPAPVVIPAPAPTPTPAPASIVIPPPAPVIVPPPSPVVVPAPVPAPVVVPPPAPTTNTKYCCKHCSTGKACGDSCISRSYTCHQPPGCACDY